jgi:uncharacterized protein YidB (DUF937 family)
MANDILGQILGGLGGALGGQQSPGGTGGLGGLGDLLGRITGGGAGTGDEQSSFGGKGALMAMLLPLAMQWVQRNGGIGAVLDRFRQQGHGQQTQSWLSTGANEPVGTQAVADVIGMDELSRMSQQLGVSEEEVAGGMAQILPEVVNHVSPAGALPHDADDQLGSVMSALSGMLSGMR